MSHSLSACTIVIFLAQSFVDKDSKSFRASVSFFTSSNSNSVRHRESCENSLRAMCAQSDVLKYDSLSTAMSVGFGAPLLVETVAKPATIRSSARNANLMVVLDAGNILDAETVSKRNRATFLTADHFSLTLTEYESPPCYSLCIWLTWR